MGSCWFFLSILLLLLLPPLFPAHAQLTEQDRDFGMAITYDVTDKDAENGDIVSLKIEDGTYVRSNKAYDDKMFGVIVEDPILLYRNRDPGTPILRAGNAWINVSTLNGAIQIGDYITSSEIAGKGQRATQLSGYLLGVSLTAFDGKNTQDIATYKDKTYKVGKVQAAIGIGPATAPLLKASGGVFGTLKQMTISLLYNIQLTKEAERIFRYIFAGFIALVTIFINLHTFGKNITKGIESIGRNPLAKASIQSMIILNIGLIAIMTLGGIMLSVAIISL